MSVHFGVVEKYFSEKGFGFITHPLDSKIRKDVFFHIRNIKKSNKIVADKLSSYAPGDNIYFYYEAENTSKGEQVKSILPTDSIGELLKSNLHNLTQTLERIWQDFETPQPVWLCDVTQDIIGTDGLNKLKQERGHLIEKKKEAEELKRKGNYNLNFNGKREKELKQKGKNSVSIKSSNVK